MLEKQQQVWDLTGAAFFDKGTLQTKTIRIRDQSEPPNFQGSH
jgi:hypothetical protein